MEDIRKLRVTIQNYKDCTFYCANQYECFARMMEALKDVEWRSHGRKMWISELRGQEWHAIKSVSHVTLSERSQIYTFREIFEYLRLYAKAYKDVAIRRYAEDELKKTEGGHGAIAEILSRYDNSPLAAFGCGKGEWYDW